MYPFTKPYTNIIYIYIYIYRRHFCQSMQYGHIENKGGRGGTGADSAKKGMTHAQLNGQLLQKPFSTSPSVFPLWSGGFGSMERRNLGVEPGQPYLSATVVCARNLPSKASDSQISYFFSALQHIYCEVWLEPTQDQLILRSSKQPRSENPTFRDELAFPLFFLQDISLPSSASTSASSSSTSSSNGKLNESELLARFKILTLHFRIYVVTPSALSTSTVLLAQTSVSMKSLPSLTTSTCIPSTPIAEWFALRNSSNNIISPDCEVRIKLQIKT